MVIDHDEAGEVLYRKPNIRAQTSPAAARANSNLISMPIRDVANIGSKFQRYDSHRDLHICTGTILEMTSYGTSRYRLATSQDRDDDDDDKQVLAAGKKSRT